MHGFVQNPSSVSSNTSWLNQLSFASVNNTSIVDFSRWHDKLGHPFFAITRKVIHSLGLENKCGSDDVSVCTRCQLAKSHRLPFLLMKVFLYCIWIFELHHCLH